MVVAILDCNDLLKKKSSIWDILASELDKVANSVGSSGRN